MAMNKNKDACGMLSIYQSIKNKIKNPPPALWYLVSWIQILLQQNLSVFPPRIFFFGKPHCTEAYNFLCFFPASSNIGIIFRRLPELPANSLRTKLQKSPRIFLIYSSAHLNSVVWSKDFPRKMPQEKFIHLLKERCVL